MQSMKLNINDNNKEGRYTVICEYIFPARGFDIAYNYLPANYKLH